MRVQVWTRTIDYLVESLWLLAIVAVPIYFDTMTTRIFEPDKIVLFRNIVLVMAVLVLLRVLIALPRAMTRGAGVAPTVNVEEAGAGAGGAVARALPWWRRLIAQNPMIIPVIVFIVVYTAATVHSVLPGISFWGAYDRLQGLYTWLCYIAFFAILAYYIRSWAQIERVISAIVFASLPVAVYGIMQHFHLDPVQWGADTTTRVSSTLGNPIFLGAYLLMTLPFASYRLWRAVERLRGAAAERRAAALAALEPVRASDARGRNAKGNGRAASRRTAPPRPQRSDVITITGLPPIVPVIGYAVVILCALLAMYYCGSRGPDVLGLVPATFILGFPFTLKFRNPYPAMASIVLAALFFFTPDIVKALTPPPSPSSSATTAAAQADASHLTDYSDAGSTQVRFYIWEGSLGLIKAKPLLGWGPEDMIYVYAPYYPSGLGHIERANAAPDRNHDEEMDFLVFSGFLGLLAWFGLLGSFAYALFKALRRRITPRATLLGSAILAAIIGHLGEGLVGIPIVSTLMLVWTMFALAVVMYMRPELSAARQDVVAEAQAVAASASAVPAGVAAAVPAGRGGGRKRGGTATAQRPRRGQPAPPVARAASFESLSARQQGGMLGATALLIAAVIGAILLFNNNDQVVQADAFDKNATSYDNVGAACLVRAQSATDPNGAACPAGSATAQQIVNAAGNPQYPNAFIPTAISLYQQAIAAQPSQDMYYLRLGKAYLDEANYYRLVQQQAVNAHNTQAAAQATQNAVAQFKDARQVLMQARALNPYNADHPMNLARMYTVWASSIDPSQWPNADKYYKIATRLADHNGRWWDEWGTADMTHAAAQGVSQAQQKALYTQALAHFQHACQVDDLLGDARVYRGDAEQSLAAVTTDPARKRALFKQAAASYAEAIKIGGFENFGQSDPSNPGQTIASAHVIQALISADANAGDFKALMRPIVPPGATTPVFNGSSPMTLAYSSTYTLNTSSFSPTLQAISQTLRQKGLVK